MYAMVATRPDLCFSVGFLGRYLSCPTTAHLSIAKYILGYLKGTPKVCLKYYGRSEQNLSLLLQGYGDTDFAGSDTRRSTTGHVYTLGASPIVWSSRLQRLVATSTTEAEYIGCFETAKDAIWLRNYVCELGYPCGGPTPIHQDNLSCITLTRDDAHHSRTKHIDIKYHFTRDQIVRRVIDIATISSEDNVADIFTKAQPRTRFATDCKRLCLVPGPHTSA